jgi:phosphoribosyl 1,2-cyclic phosphate phosphodiesterase
MLREKVQRIEAIVLTHEHNDHIMGMDDVRPFNFRYEMDMPIYATERVQDALKKRFNYAFELNPYPGAPRFQLHTINKNHPFNVAGFEITPIELSHGLLPVMGFRLGDFTYMTDMKSIKPEELKKVEGTKTLVLDALHHSVHHSHLNLEEALELVTLIQPEQTYLIHASHKMGRYADISKDLPQQVHLAYDGLKLIL